MNTIVLAVAGLFVLAGLALIVLAFLVGKTKPGGQTAPTVSETAGDTVPFIDEPLQTDLAAELGDAAGPAEAQGPATTTPAEATVGPAAPAVAEPSPFPEAPPPPEPPAETTSPVAERLYAEDAPAEQAAAGAEAPAARPAARPAAELRIQRVGYNFRVQLGFKFLKNGLYEDAVTEFQKALTLTDDKEAKLKLYVEIGNTFRAKKMYAPASAAYLQATAYTDNRSLLDHLERTIADMAHLEKIVKASPEPEPEKEE